MDKETGNGLKIASIRLENKLIKVDTNGYFSCIVVPKRYSVTGFCYSYIRLVTKSLMVGEGETIDLKIYLLINSEGTNN
ncbi:hypothetical protein GCM10028818_25650 [Spirosoma horti]